MIRHGLEIEFLGTGTSTGVPQIGCRCQVCLSSDDHDKRYRASAIVRYKGVNLLIDCGPDFRSQMLRASSQDIDALLVTHIHYDHVGGMDDLRAYCSGGPFPVYARQDVIDDLHRHMPYCFAEHPYPGVPSLNLIPIVELMPFEVSGVKVIPVPVHHGGRLICGFRIGPLAYITDAKTIDAQTVEALNGVELLVVNALRIAPHHSHMSLDEALNFVKAVSPRKALLIHMSHDIGLHKEVNAMLPPEVQLAHDGLIVCI